MALTSAFKTAAFSADTDQVFLVLLTIAQADLAQPIRVVNNNEDITSNGNVFTAFPFDIELPDSREGVPPSATLVIDNVSQEIAQAVRTMTSVATVLIQIIRAADPDTIERSYTGFNLRDVKWNAHKMSGDLILEDFQTEPYPALQFSPAFFPGLF